MLTYHFALHHDADGSENLGFMDLANDKEAFDFGRETIRLIMRDDPHEFLTATMEITEGVRLVGRLALEHESNRTQEIRTQRSNSAGFEPVMEMEPEQGRSSDEDDREDHFVDRRPAEISEDLAGRE
jgi:hypothetical protein